MESPWESKKRLKPQEVQQGKTQRSQTINEGEDLHTCIPLKPGNKNKSIKTKQRHIKLCIPNTFYPWKFGTINIRTGNEKDDGHKMYCIAKEAAKAKLQVCCLQEVRYRNIDSKVIALNNDESYTFFWSEQKKRRNAGVGILIKKD